MTKKLSPLDLEKLIGAETPENARRRLHAEAQAAEMAAAAIRRKEKAKLYFAEQERQYKARKAARKAAAATSPAQVKEQA